jgi:hypothetical protein
MGLFYELCQTFYRDHLPWFITPPGKPDIFFTDYHVEDELRVEGPPSGEGHDKLICGPDGASCQNSELARRRLTPDRAL